MNRMFRALVIASLSTIIVACSSSDGDDDTSGIDTPVIDNTDTDTNFDTGAGIDTNTDTGIDTNPDTTLNPLVPVIADPAPEFNDPGSFSCDGCPDSDVTEFSLNTPDTSFVSSGRVTGADGNGTYTILGDDGSAIEGEKTIKYIWSNEAGRYVLVTEANRTDCTSADIQLTLTWDNLGIDFELHLIEQGGRINDAATDCTWNTCVTTQPDWGVVGDASDNPVKDVDVVEHWNSGGDPMADGSVVFNVAGETTIIEAQDLPPFTVWFVGTIEWPSGEVVLDNRRLDCGPAWENGCTLDLPALWPETTTANP